MNPIRQLSELTDRQREILKLFCDGCPYKAIAEQLFIAVSTVKTHMGNIYIKLKLHELPPARRRMVLAEKYCPLLRKAELPPPPPEETDEPEPVPESILEMVEEDERALVPWEPPELPVVIEPQRVEIIEIETQQPPPPRRLRWLLVGMVLGGLLLVGIISAFGGFPWTEETPASVTQATQPVQITNTSVIQEVTREVPVIQTSVVTREVIAEITATRPPPQPTDTSPPPATATKGVDLLFEDNFEAGLSSDWQVESGHPVIVNDALTTPETTWLIVGDSSWTDYTVEFDAIEYSSSIVAVRLQDLDNLIAFSFRFTNSSWYVVENGNWNEVPNSRSGNIGYPPGHIKITVEGDKFTASIGERRLSSFFDSTYQQGRVGLRLGEEAIFDNFRITPLSR